MTNDKTIQDRLHLLHLRSWSQRRQCEGKSSHGLLRVQLWYALSLIPHIPLFPTFHFLFPNYFVLLESQFGGMALCTNEGIRFIVNTKEPYTGAIYAAERFSTCSQVRLSEFLQPVAKFLERLSKEAFFAFSTTLYSLFSKSKNWFQVVENAKQISITFPPPTVSSDCGTVIRVTPRISPFL